MYVREKGNVDDLDYATSACSARQCRGGIGGKWNHKSTNYSIML